MEPATNLCDLSSDLLVGILSHLTPRHALSALSTCKSLHELGSTETTLWRDVFQTMCGSCAKSSKLALRCLKELTSQEPKRLSLVGVLTDGGIDVPTTEVDNDEALLNLSERQLPCWVNSMFTPVPWLVYCSASNRKTATCIGALAGYHDWVLEDHEKTRRSYMLERLQVVADRVWGMDVHGFGGLASQPPSLLDEAFYAASDLHFDLLLHGLQSGIERRAHTIKIRRIRGQIEAQWRASRERRPRLAFLEVGNHKCIIDPNPRPSLAPKDSVAVVFRIVLRKAKTCSCPASHLALYASMGVPREEETLQQHFEELDRLDTEHTTEDDWWLVEDVVGKSLKRTSTPDGVFIEYPPPEVSSPRPALIGLHTFTLHEGSEQLGDGDESLMTVVLERPRPMRSLIVKLLRAENLMELCNDTHPQMNIDMDFVGADGIVLREMA